MAGHNICESAYIPASKTPTTDPENGQLLQPHADSEDLSQMSLQHGDQYLEKVLSQIRRDSVYELRKLQHHHRPVTGFDSKPALEELLGRRSQALPPAETQQAGSEVDRHVRHFQAIAISSTGGGGGDADSAQEHMPSSIRLEIRGLIERQRVSELLNSARAGEIERTLNEALERRERQMQQQQQRRARPQSRPAQGRRMVGEPRGEAFYGDGLSPLGGAVSLRPMVRQPENGQQYPVPQRDQSSIVRHLRESPALGSLQPAERDRIVNEVDNLVQQHLVTSTLSGELRGVLELHIQSRADQVRNGVTAEDVGRSLQRRSEYTASTARPFYPEVPSSAAMSEMQTELREMKSQILELKQLMRTSFDLQLEIQRAIRQEVAAALSSACVSPSLSSMPPISTVAANTTVVNSGNCVICSEASITSVVYRCGHMCVCMQCGLELKAQGLKCPICRAPITDIIRAYSSMQ